MNISITYADGRTDTAETWAKALTKVELDSGTEVHFNIERGLTHVWTSEEEATIADESKAVAVIRTERAGQMTYDERRAYRASLRMLMNSMG